jgi:gamma-glutamylcyclotransferase (GGCT)/AIG2-like uncharacterized protein YtfP
VIVEDETAFVADDDDIVRLFCRFVFFFHRKNVENMSAGSVQIPPPVQPSETEQLAIFVYGTLVIGQPNEHRWLGAVQRHARASIGNARLHAFPAFPMMLVDTGDALADERVRGEVVWVDATRFDEVLRSLDALEDFDVNDVHASVYLRVRVTATLDETGESVPCFTYCARAVEQVRDCPRVPDNDWVALASQSSAVNEWWANQNRSGSDVRQMTDTAE